MSDYIDKTILTWTIIFIIVDLLLLFMKVIEPSLINFLVPYIPFTGWFIYRGFFNASSS